MAKLTVFYATPNAGAGGNGRDKIKLKLVSPSGFTASSQILTLADTIVDGKVVLNYLGSGKVFVDDLSIILVTTGASGPRSLPPASSGVLPPPAAPQ